MNVSELYIEIGQLLNDANNTRWPATVLLPRINQAQIHIQKFTNAIKTREELTPVAGTSEVQLDTDTIDIIRIDIKRTGGSWFKLKGFLRDQLDFEEPNWQQRNDGESVAYWYDGTNQKVMLVPAPDSNNAIANGLRVWEVQVPTALTTTTDVPFASNTAMVPYHVALAYWVVAQCWMDDGTPEALAKSKFHRSGDFRRPGNFEIEIKKIWGTFDTPEDIPARILWRPQGGRANTKGIITKSNPFRQ